MESGVFHIFVIAEEEKTAAELGSGLTQSGFVSSTASDGSGVVETVAQKSPDLVLVDLNDCLRLHELSRIIKEELELPVIALVNNEMLDKINGHWDMDDFAIKPCEVRELVLRVKRILRKISGMESDGLIRCGDLVINPAKYEVSVGNRLAMLTFKEYELLKFLVSNRGRVFTREVLLNRVWGYDYYGGDRTVDVHVRRLRSKIENPLHTFIETVRNIGYRFVNSP